MWRGLADVVDRYVNKGSQIYIEGRLRTREWTDKDNNCLLYTSNLPNADWIRKEHGSKSVTIDNITYAYAQAAHGDGFLEEFMLRPEDRERIDKYGKLADDLHTDLHECLGHGSGQLAPGVKGGELKNYTSTREEARADLFGLYYLGDPKMVELGLIDVYKRQP